MKYELRFDSEFNDFESDVILQLPIKELPEISISGNSEHFSTHVLSDGKGTITFK